MATEHISVMITFKVREGEVPKAQTVIREFISAIQKNEPDTLLYKSFQQSEEPERFVHIMTFENKAAQELHRNSEYCRKFVEALYPLCSEKPTPVSYNEVI